MKHEITTSNSGDILIDVTGAPDERAALLRSFEKCRSGQCGCPINEHAKIEGMDLRMNADNIHIRIESKTGATINADAVAKCLTWTEIQVVKNKKTA